MLVLWFNVFFCRGREEDPKIDLLDCGQDNNRELQDNCKLTERIVKNYLQKVV